MDDNEPNAAGSKQDPRTLELRARPRPVARFRRSVIAGLTALGAAGIMALTWWALDAAHLEPWPVGEDLLKGSGQPSAEGLGTLPDSYDDLKPAPELGPPLPGDLGPPVLQKEREYGIEPAAPLAPDPDAEAARAERLRLAQQARQARESDVFIQLRQNGERAASTAPVESQDNGTGETDQSRDHDETLNDRERKRDFLDREHNGSMLDAHELDALHSPYEVLAGTVIPASLITGLNSDLPGRVLAQVTEPVYDTATGQFLLVPQGARIIGTYDSDIAYGQSRALVIWERLILPNGKSLKIENLPATDTEGYAGLADAVDYHTWSLVKGIVLSTLLNVGSELTLGSEENELLRALGRSTQQSVENAGEMIVRRELGVQPSITVRPGWPLRIIVHKDVILEPYEG
jgi:type IV secretory pathway VirB10-like protein